MSSTMTLRFEEGLWVDVLVEGRIICELKAVEKIIPSIKQRS